ncbi:hypothetical protein Taro_035750 [Colocasia esculenta]|uniref:Amino acid transporter transmembrane domain-containing protein n=1 Tax=Colocasia esculenta TaxID=4460 RepID=A0A843W188_COLES|nr:hypothetical protein [Colocasia esculenta]
MTIGGLQPAPERAPRSSSRRGSSELAAPLLPRRHADAATSAGEPVGTAGNASFVGSVFNLSTNIVGAGIMALPACARVLGVVPVFALILLVAFLTEAAIELLLRFSRAGKAFTYAGVMGDAFGWGGRVLLQVAVVVKIVGVLIVYMIIVGDVLSGTTSSGVRHSGVLEGWFGLHWWTGRFFVLLVTTLVVFLPLACFKRLDSLRYTSALSVMLAVVFVVITVGIAILKLLNGSVSVAKLFPTITDLASIWNLFTVVPVIVTAYICHYNGMQADL